MTAAFVRADQVQTYTGKSCQSKHQAKTGERPAHIERRPGPVISVGWTRSGDSTDFAICAHCSSDTCPESSAQAL